METIKVLLIEDDKVDQIAFQRFIKKENIPYEYTVSGSLKEAEEMLQSQTFDIIIIDYFLGDGTAYDLIKSITDTPVIVATGTGTEETAVKIMKAGVYDYLIKDPDRNYLKVLPITVKNAIYQKNIAKKFKLLSHAIMSVSEGIYITNMSNTIIYVNTAFCKLYGYKEQEIIGKDAAILGETAGKGEFAHTRKDGTKFPVLLSKSIVKDEDMLETAIVVVVMDITERKKAEETIRYMAYHDALTGLPNRLLFNDHLSLAINQAQRIRRKVGIMLLDLDKFKEVNDSLGHHIGDLLLQAVARSLTAVLRKTDTIARMGGDEFMIIAPELKQAVNASKIAQHIIDVFQKPFQLNECELSITTSIGIAVYPNDGTDTITLIKKADIAMYDAKNTGRNMYRYYQPPEAEKSES